MLFQNIYHKSRVFITGHTGFKGSWLTTWLVRLGAEICGFSDNKYTEPSHYRLLQPNIRNVCGDVRNYDHLLSSIKASAPDIVFHLAAQPLVRRSYDDPLETFSTNIIGTANVLQACCQVTSVRAIVVVTTDKVYENREQHHGYHETDTLGGYDPYAASKVCTEIVAASFRRSFLDEKNILLATCRAGNAIGGGDWAKDRLIPDLVRATAQGKILQIRMPYAIRPWQHVLEPLAGYLLIGQKLLEGDTACADAWNFGHDAEGNISVEEIVQIAAKHWEQLRVELTCETSRHETSLLMLDCSKARNKLGWKPIWNLEKTVAETIVWYRQFYTKNNIQTLEQLEMFVEDANRANAVWYNSQ